MSVYNNDESYLKAQRAYDNQLPPEYDTIECEDCDGTGTVPLSNCCGADVDTDILICSDCKEHCDISECDTCAGNGYVTKKTKKQLKAEWLADQEPERDY
jgi:DnaJ-class molecular chaperone